MDNIEIINKIYDHVLQDETDITEVIRVRICECEGAFAGDKLYKFIKSRVMLNLASTPCKIYRREWSIYIFVSMPICYIIKS